MTAFSIQTAAQLQTTQPEPTFPSIPSVETLTERLLAYDFPSGFADRLAGEEGWTLAFALAVLREYRRFVVLAATAGQSVTPSRAVDAAWHLHLTYTRDYWLRLTPLLPATLHHDPSAGLADDSAHFARQYQETLTLYRARFGEPDSLIWPAAASPEPQHTRTSRRHFPAWLTLLTLWILGGAALFRFGSWAVLGLIGLGFVLLLARRARQSAGRPRSTSSSSGDDSGFLSFSGFLAGFDGGSSCDSGSSDSSSGCSSDGGGGDGGGSGCGSGCGGGCGS
ncbi:glycine-rich domain-containing protein [Deinococcus alpinitundrae]|uniref:glycine-rich domain-containing protein n=1 Tax=Deinococcus alpinitundrae TaxID=468913 RepID=UPI0013799F05|nr:hypothetical protein [Deinococcus alpinitundrae]